MDEISIKHNAYKDGFAIGAVIAAEWLVNKKGIFSMNDVLKFNNTLERIVMITIIFIKNEAMTLLQWVLFFFLIQVVHFLGTWRLYRAAGFNFWQALIPIYNAYVLMQIIRRPKWWVLLLFVPTINLIIFAVIWVETLRSFGWNSTKNTMLVIFLRIYIYALNCSDNQNIFQIEV